MHCASDSELDVAVLWIGCIDYFTIGMSTVKNNLIPINKIDGTSNFVGTDFPEEIFPLPRCQDLRAIHGKKLFTFPSSSYTASIPHDSLSYDLWVLNSALNALQG
jgi:hypothetical protein